LTNVLHLFTIELNRDDEIAVSGTSDEGHRSYKMD
jgi:hypothetical protein